MPRPRLTEQQRRERALAGAIARAAAEEGLELDKDIAKVIGMTDKTYSYYKKKKFQNANLEQFGRLARNLRLTGREVCAAIGIPYEETIV